MRDRLVQDLGFTAEEGEQFLQKAPTAGPGLFTRIIDVSRRPNFNGIDPVSVQSVRVVQSTDGDWSVELREFVPEVIEERILAEVAAEQKGQARARVAEHNRTVQLERAAMPERKPISVPQLYVRVADQNLLFTWELAGEEAPMLASDLSDDTRSFSFTPVDGRFSIDFQAGRLDVRPLMRTELPFYKTGWQSTHISLIRWLSREVRTVSLGRPQLDAWLNAITTKLEESTPLETVWNSRFAIARRLSEMLAAAQADAHARGYQKLLIETYVPPSDDDAFHFLPDRYRPNALYRGLSFSRHFYRNVGEMNGPEEECARALDSMPGIETWVRNIERDQANSFKLPKQHNFFYPDFVARLTDGRVLVVEYKGELRDYEDAEEKRALGELWQSRTVGVGVFAWIESRQVTGKTIEHQIQCLIS